MLQEAENNTDKRIKTREVSPLLDPEEGGGWGEQRGATEAEENENKERLLSSSV